MKNIHEALEDPTRAAILAQISIHSGSISAKEISRNIDIPLTTVYFHLKTLEKSGFITAKEEKIRNLTKKVWQRSPVSIEPQGSRILNQYYQQTVNRDAQVIVSYVRYLKALLKENLVDLKRTDPETFEKFQKNTPFPFFVKIYGLTQDDYNYALTKIMELRKELYKREMSRGVKEYQITDFTPDRTYLLCLLAFPDLVDLQECGKF